jgi:hypothetical protein
MLNENSFLTLLYLHENKFTVGRGISNQFWMGTEEYPSVPVVFSQRTRCRKIAGRIPILSLFSQVLLWGYSKPLQIGSDPSMQSH